MRWNSELGLVVGMVMMVLVTIIAVQCAGDPKPCTTAMCGGAR